MTNRRSTTVAARIGLPAPGWLAWANEGRVLEVAGQLTAQVHPLSPSCGNPRTHEFRASVEVAP